MTFGTYGVPGSPPPVLATDNQSNTTAGTMGATYLGLAEKALKQDKPDHNRAVALLGDEGGHMVSFEITGGRAAANALTKAADEIAFAPTLGDVNTTLSHPPSSSHRALTEEARAAIGISEGFFRVSVGVEPVEGLIEAFRRGVAAASSA